MAVPFQIVLVTRRSAGGFDQLPPISLRSSQPLRRSSVVQIQTFPTASAGGGGSWRRRSLARCPLPSKAEPQPRGSWRGCGRATNRGRPAAERRLLHLGDRWQAVGVAGMVAEPGGVGGGVTKLTQTTGGRPAARCRGRAICSPAGLVETGFHGEDRERARVTGACEISEPSGRVTSGGQSAQKPGQPLVGLAGRARRGEGPAGWRAGRGRGGAGASQPPSARRSGPASAGSLGGGLQQAAGLAHILRSLRPSRQSRGRDWLA